jgi:NADH-quinone oxidoreductase subunit L
MANTSIEVPAIVSGSYWILLFPLLSFLINGLWLGRRNANAVAAVSSTLAGAAFVWAVSLVIWYFNTILAAPEAFPDRTFIAWSYDWLPIHGSLVARLGIYLDPISVMMLFVVTAIALLVNIYSVGYMREDPAKGRFFALLSLFAFSMLGLVISSNIFQMFVFWELVGVSSWSLIGFWYHKPSAVAASKKAFIMTRFADGFFLLGMILVTWFTKSFDFQNLNSPETVKALQTTVNLGFFEVNALAAGTILIFAGGWGKSAMFPLHIWLPDAMEGPTPVSSIIHSATMVVAGVYLTARMFPLFVAAEYTLTLIAYIGAFTALFSAVIAITQKDIKRILAFSTLSQLGYMMFSLGVASMNDGHGAFNPLGYSASMFHVFTHAFFKCMLFLGAGSIIHAVHSNDLDAMGGLRKKMPFTYVSLLLAALAIGGFPGLSGFFSKDEIIVTAWQSGHQAIAVLGLLVGGMTAFYMFRFFFLIFHGEPRSDLHHAHEDKFMTIPIVILTIPTVIAGFALKDIFHHYVVPPMALPEAHLHHPHWMPFVAGGIGILGIALAWLFYGRKTTDTKAVLEVENRPGWYKVVYDKFYLDEGWYWFSRTFVFRYVARPIKWADTNIADGWVRLSGLILRIGSFVVRQFQTGHIPFYLTAMIFGVFFIFFLGKLPF